MSRGLCLRGTSNLLGGVNKVEVLFDLFNVSTVDARSPCSNLFLTLAAPHRKSMPDGLKEPMKTGLTLPNLPRNILGGEGNEVYGTILKRVLDIVFALVKSKHFSVAGTTTSCRNGFAIEVFAHVLWQPIPSRAFARPLQHYEDQEAAYGC